MAFIHAVVLGIIQGVAELFPISSAAHTLLLSYLFGWQLPSLPFVVMLHLGTFLAVLVYFARDYGRLIAGFFTGFGDAFRQPFERLALLIIAGTIPLAIVGKVFEKFFDRLFAMPVFAAAFLLVTGLVLFAVERLRQRDLKAEQLSFGKAVLIGLSQVGGLVPGGSRSGFSIAGGMLAGMSREEAARFSFLLAGPAIVGASAFEIRRIVHPHAEAVGQHNIALLGVAPEPLAVIATGFVVAFLCGLFAIRFFMRYVDRHRLTPFAVYCWIFGGACLAIIALRGHAAAP
ncbi:MAG: undecaprenyl-diphosphate phosphatase [Candidatus Eremiobacteraeota bacterium]|nr:undecaprenyl-diphosphate phosphatase [Candidatus Eremiobacteraeota bacterium]MBV8460191.1 undecaprenyl-diphosphate phosphatase [Candidatus Eremiobacteraeota bacterium]MBV8668866.1 undecaprenyl-diphosphate phosphatase [Candidatus Eremiobacteraeota bacterium]